MNPTSRYEHDEPRAAAHALIVYEPAPHAQYPLDMVARLTRVSRHRIAVYCQHGLVHALGDPAETGWTFDDAAVGAIRRLEQLRTMFGLNTEAARLVMSLTDEIEQLRREVRFLREQ